MKTTLKTSAYDLPRSVKFSMCYKIKGQKEPFDLIDISSAQARWFLSHFPSDYYFINRIGKYCLINVFLEKTGI
jgi:hypothetical protein